MDRRSFLKRATAGAVAAAIPGCGRQTAGSTPVASASNDGSVEDTGPSDALLEGSLEAAHGEAQAQASARPNVLIIFNDQLRADVCGVYGGQNITTPNIDRLARESIVFSNSVSSCPLCTPYRGMLQTGRYPTHSGIILNYVEASDVQNPHCMANIFGAAGYQTGYIGKWHLASGFHREEGMDWPNDDAIAAYVAKNPEPEHVAPGPSRLGHMFWQAYNLHLDFNNYWYYEDEPVKIFSDRYETETEIDQAIAYMEKHRQSGQPFLLTVAPHPPHPYFVPEETPAGYLDEIPESIPWPPNVPTENNPRTLLEVRCYLAMAKNVDDNIGRLLAYLESSGLAESTIVVFSSDHGEMHGSHGRVNKLVPYAESVNVPLIMRWPGRIPAGLRVDSLHTPMDHLPTLCGLVGLPIPGEVDGADLSQVVLGKGSDAREEVLMANYTSEAEYCMTGTTYPEWRGVKTKQYTYCRWLAGGEELYDNAADPYQMQNLVDSGQHREVLQHLRARMSELLQEAHDGFWPGTGYVGWFGPLRNLVATGLGPVPGHSRSSSQSLRRKAG